MTDSVRTSDDLVTSESEEMYLITIAMAVEDGHDGPVPVSHLARELDVSRVSANEMVKKLAARGLIDYTPYKGVSLAGSGEGIARSVLRRRRLWSVFLSEQLGLTPAAADAVACEFEHVTPADVAQRLSEFLGDPQVGPAGKPIPAAVSDAHPEPHGALIADVEVGVNAEVLNVGGSRADVAFLHAEGIAPGQTVTLSAVAADGSCLVVTGSGRVHLTADVANLVRVVAG